MLLPQRVSNGQLSMMTCSHTPMVKIVFGLATSQAAQTPKTTLGVEAETCIPLRNFTVYKSSINLNSRVDFKTSSLQETCVWMNSESCSITMQWQGQPSKLWQITMTTVSLRGCKITMPSLVKCWMTSQRISCPPWSLIINSGSGASERILPIWIAQYLNIQTIRISW